MEHERFTISTTYLLNSMKNDILRCVDIVWNKVRSLAAALTAQMKKYFVMPKKIEEDCLVVS
ncbi:hypothetical protein IQ22_01118 [Pseudomonas duriflava]|uniref:Uncharacterized protein n=1 Tax=Pseudomonas duriflava TaxID=459528 RepID=A0A562QKU1_9PSED|nr:hypothetical protein IQ22_01118 [Pseudomonas duriflava]